MVVRKIRQKVKRIARNKKMQEKLNVRKLNLTDIEKYREIINAKIDEKMTNITNLEQE